MKGTAQSRRGYVFLAALGVMAVAFLVVVAMTESAKFSYHTVGQTHKRIQGRVVANTAGDYALSLVAQGAIKADGVPVPFEFTANRLRHLQVKGTVGVRTLNDTHMLYKLPVFTHRPGDVLVRVESDRIQTRSGGNARSLLCNLSANRQRPIDVTDVLERGSSD